MSPVGKPRVLVAGCGGIGGVVACRLIERGHAPTIVTTNQAVRDALIRVGPRFGGSLVCGPLPPRQVLEQPTDSTFPFDIVFLAVQPPQVEDATRQILPVLAREGRLVCFQNGLCEERLSMLVGADRVIGGVVAWGASMPAPACFEQTSAGGFTLGVVADEHGARVPPQLRVVRELLECIGPVTLTENLRGVRWSKLAINCAVSTLGTLGGTTLGDLLARRFVRRLALEILTEVVAVADAESVELEPVAGTIDLRWLLLRESGAAAHVEPKLSALMAKHAMLLAVGARYRRLRSSMLRAMERGRPPAVDFLNGEVVQRASRHGIAVPINARAVRMVWEIAERRRLPGLETLRELHAELP